MSHAVRQFEFVERYLSVRLDADLGVIAPGEPTIVETPARLRREESFSYVRALWWLRLEDGRQVVSAPPGTAEEVRRILSATGDDPAALDVATITSLRSAIDAALLRAGLPPTNRAIEDLYFACDSLQLHHHPHPSCRRLADASLPPAEGLSLPGHCFPDGVVYGIVADQRVVSVAYAHRTGVMEDQVADLGVVTAPAYRRRGFAQAAVAAVVAHFTQRGGQAVYYCAPQNAASIATARSVGFVPFGRSLILAAPWSGQ